MAQKPSIPKGTRDFNPQEVAKRNYIFNTIRREFEIFGFQPIETPSFENSSTLMGKYGDEGDRLIFKILNSGEFYEKKIEGTVERSISVYLALTYIFRSTVNAILKDIKDKNVEFLTEDEFNNYEKDIKLKEFVLEKITEFTSLIIDDNELHLKTLEILNNEIPLIIYNSLQLIRGKGLDFSQRINDEKLVEWQLKWADRRVLTKFSKVLYQKISEILPDAKEVNSQRIASEISEKALRYDLTVPFARYVVQHQNEIDFPFKRYQIQPVWRADRPQKGRFREFYQCDADVVGSNSLWQEVEFVQLYDAVFTALKLEGVTIKINNRKILSGIAEVIGAQDKLIDFTVALDKLDKIGEEKVKAEMLDKGIPQSGIDKLHPLFHLKGNFGEQISELKSILETSEEGKKGIEELEFINDNIEALGLKTAILQLDVTLARGLNYYTGAIFEVAAPEGVQMGSIGGGGRYDDLTGIFGLKDMSGVGISFGLDRIALVLEDLNLFPKTITNTVKVLFINFGTTEAMASMKAIKALREHGVSAELFPDKKKTIKQFNYANKREIPYVVLLGESELASSTYTLKNMDSGEQQQLTLNALISELKS